MKKNEMGNRKIYTMADTKPEIALVYAVLERAFLDAQGMTIAGSRSDQTSAIVWFKKEPEDDYIEDYSFPWVCQHLNCCPSLMRKRIFKFLRSNDQKKGSRRDWQNIATMITDESPALGDYDIYYEGSETVALSILEQDEIK